MMHIITPIYYLPPISCVALYIQNEDITIESFEHYQKGTFRNKCKIGTSQGPLLLSIPLRRGKHQSQDIRQVLISNEDNWALQHIRSIRTAYSNTPYFEHYFYQFEEIFQKPHTLLWEFNLDMLKIIQQCIGSNIDFSFSLEYISETGNDIIDLRNKKRPFMEIPPYPQVHEGGIPFQQDLSIIDLIFHLGPEALSYLKSIRLNN